MALRLPRDTVFIRLIGDTPPGAPSIWLGAISDAFVTRGLPVLDVRRADDPVGADAGPATIRRAGSSAFVGTDLEARLEEGGHTTLVFAGGPIEDGLGSTVRHAADLGFRAILAVDACHAGDLGDPTGRRWSAEEVLAMTVAELAGRHAAAVAAEAVLLALNRLRGPRFSPPRR